MGICPSSKPEAPVSPAPVAPPQARQVLMLACHLNGEFVQQNVARAQRSLADAFATRAEEPSQLYLPLVRLHLQGDEAAQRDDDGAETAAPPRGEDDARAEDVTSPRFMRTRADAKVVPRGETPKRSEAAGAFLCGNQPLGRDIPEFRQNFDSMFRSTPAPRCAQGNCTLKAP